MWFTQGWEIIGEIAKREPGSERNTPALRDVSRDSRRRFLYKKTTCFDSLIIWMKVPTPT
jgi:hypothetical protein